ncbi:hypothetical protein H5P28_00290 [Ruficoccus amylovorans]|uniref:DUF2190 family protein n=1 Tax=Ruficoccus amylovorans TaxID=1804625 RepID=A0A842H8L9_9BACT|nr:hypothetical protein [Ruficoccus amylovorans]MBC2592690.1 hypothetical protein [Ruficoccus amylovorans]
MKTTYQLGPVITLTAANIASLEGKENHLVSVDATGKAALLSGSALAIGVFDSRLAPDSDEIAVRLLSGGGTLVVRQSAAIAPGARVAGVAASATVTTAAAGTRSLGVKVSPATNGAAGDLIEIIPLVETIPGA